MWVTSSTAKAQKPNYIALGNFDGIHRGHQQVVQPVLDRIKTAPLTTDGFSRAHFPRPRATVVTFSPHPHQFFTGQQKNLLTPLDEKIHHLKRLGVEQLMLLPFDRELAALGPQEFVEKILVQQLDVKFISVGADFCFGRGRSGTSADLRAIAQRFGITTHITPLQTDTEERISSSLIRAQLTAGELQRANCLLGRPYGLRGQVIHGQKLGRTLGFPTANLAVPPQKQLPAIGVYAVWVQVQPLTTRPRDPQTLDLSAGMEIAPNHHPKQPGYGGVMNIGHKPTVAGRELSIEVHLFDWSGDLYGRTLAVDCLAYLRPEQKFHSLDELKDQIQRDCTQAETFLQRTCAQF